MTDLPSWLPAMAVTDGDFSTVLTNLYTIFELDFKATGRTLEGLPVWWDRSVCNFGGFQFDEGFCHLITREDKESGDRLFDPRRAERLPWCGPLLSHATDEAVKFWTYRKTGGRPRAYVWLEEHDYVVILEKRPKRLGDVYFLVTAYFVDGPSTRRGLLRRYDERER